MYKLPFRIVKDYSQGGKGLSQHAMLKPVPAWEPKGALPQKTLSDAGFGSRVDGRGNSERKGVFPRSKEITQKRGTWKEFCQSWGNMTSPEIRLKKRKKTIFGGGFNAIH